jgi:hypothetical protein
MSEKNTNVDRACSIAIALGSYIAFRLAVCQEFEHAILRTEGVGCNMSPMPSKAKKATKSKTATKSKKAPAAKKAVAKKVVKKFAKKPGAAKKVAKKAVAKSARAASMCGCRCC